MVWCAWSRKESRREKAESDERRVCWGRFSSGDGLVDFFQSTRKTDGRSRGMHKGIRLQDLGAVPHYGRTVKLRMEKEQNSKQRRRR